MVYRSDSVSTPSPEGRAQLHWMKVAIDWYRALPPCERRGVPECEVTFVQESVDMPLNLEDKKVLVAEVTEVAKTALSVVAAENRGLTVTQFTELRAKARAQGVYMRVVKNTLARKAFAGTAFEPVGPKLKGPLLLAFSKDDPR